MTCSVANTGRDCGKFYLFYATPDEGIGVGDISFKLPLMMTWVQYQILNPHLAAVSELGHKSKTNLKN